MKVDNKQIAKAVFFKLYNSDNYRAAARVAFGIFQNTLTLGLGEYDHLIEWELENFGCSFVIGRGGSTASFNMSGQTEIDSKKWEIMCDEIYN